MEEKKAVLYLVGTPIGNLEDMTPRAIRVLEEADLVAAEDTRQTRKLFSRFGITGQLTSLHRHNEREKSHWLVEQLLSGKTVALVSDAGMPGIADPGEELVRQAAEAGVKVVVVPGPSAAMAGLALSGLDTSRFAFEGFLPKSGKTRKKQMELLKNERRTMVFYVGPHQILRDLEEMLQQWGDRRASVSREMTKLFEETRRGTLSSLLTSWQEIPPQGEMVLIVEGALPILQEVAWEKVSQEIRALIAEGSGLKAATTQVAQKYTLSRRSVYNQYLQEKDDDTADSR